MKNFLKLSCFLLALLAVSWLASSCHRENPQDEHSNCLVPIVTDSKESSTYLMMVLMGHDGKNCPGCVLANGQLSHVDCQGVGFECLKSSYVRLQEVGTSITATTLDTFDLTSEDFFSMPARSLNYTDGDNNRVYLNIPPQLVWRDTATLQFSFTGLSITNSPVYDNE